MNHALVAVALALPLCTDWCVAQQQTLLFALEREEHSLASGLLEGSLFRPDEIAAVTPRQAGPYAASVFLTMASQWAYIGDADNSFYLVNYGTDGPGYDTDAIFVKRYRSQNRHGPRDVYVSKLYDGSGLPTSIENGSVFRYSQQGVVEFFLSENQLLSAVGQTPTSDLNLDAICQDSNGNLFLSFSDQETVGTVTAPQGSIVRIPASSITYDLNGNVILIAQGSAQVVALDTDVTAMIQNSNVRTSYRQVPSQFLNVSGLEIDPTGGTWVSPQIAGLSLPNLLFCWSGTTNDGAILSTRTGGSIAAINGVSMGSTESTVAAHLGIAPRDDGTNGLGGLALIPARSRPVLAAENYPTNVVSTGTTLWQRQELSGATPNGLVLFFFDFAAAGQFPANSFPGFGGELFGIGLITNLGIATADSNGFASHAIRFPSIVLGTNTPICVQAFDAGTFSFATPAALQFQ